MTVDANDSFDRCHVILRRSVRTN